VDRLVLPSPNGSSIAYALGSSAGICLGASLRNARAVAGWIADNHTQETVVAVIAAGENGRTAPCGRQWKTSGAPAV
jgi:2-phosphosulfolactate phosphatase